jgi:hypothetical protein
MRGLILFLLMLGISAGAGAVDPTAVASGASKVAGAAGAVTSLLGLKAPPAYVPSVPPPPIVPVNMCVNGMCYPLLSTRPCVCKQKPPFPGTNLCQMYIPCNALWCGTGFCVTDLTMLPGSRQFYETLRVKEFKDTSTQLSYLLQQRSEQYYLLSGIKNAIGMPDKKIKALIEASTQTGGAPTDFGCLRCESLAELAIQQKQITPAQKTQYIMNCAQNNLAQMMDLKKDCRNNTVFTAQKQCFIDTCKSATLAHAAYSMNAYSDLLRVHARMREVFFNYIPKTLYEPCVEDYSVFNKNTTQKFLDTIKGLTNLAEGLGVNLGGLGNFSLRLKEIEMPISGCINRSLALIQNLEADRSLLEQYKAHLQSMKLLSESLNSVCHNPTYFVPQECQK